MPRDIPVGNGTLLVTFDELYRIRDIYFPFVGKENHSEGHPFRFGVWADGAFSWIGGSGGLSKCDSRYTPGNSKLHLEMVFSFRLQLAERNDGG